MATSLVDLLSERSLQAPEAPALLHGTTVVSYGELWRQVEAVAGFLRAHHVPGGARVALLMENRPEYVAAYYGALAVGAVVVPLNTAAKARDLAAQLAHCGASWLFASGRHRELPALRTALPPGLRCVTVGGRREEGEQDWVEVLSTRTAVLRRRFASERLASLMYTSGTTGDPKAIMLSHGNLLSNVRAIVEYLGLRSSDRALQVLPFYYSYGNSVLHTHLAVGASLVLENSLLYPHRVLQRLAEARCTGLPGVASMFALFMDRAGFDNYDLSALRYLTQAGGPMPVARLEQLRRALPQARLFVMYGQTEATARLSYLPPERLDDKLGSVGVPIPGTEIQIHDPAGRALPPGRVGEICARGGHIMLGYWRNAEATARVLRDGWLRTGDQGYLDAEGYLYITGRISDLIKSGAHRISPREIEEVLAELEGVAEAAVVGTPDPVLGQAITACIVVKPGSQLDERRVMAHCRARLAAYKLPKRIEFVAALPKTQTGKVQRHRLLEPQGAVQASAL